MKRVRTSIAFALFCGAVFSAPAARAEDTTPAQAPATAPDNTKINTRDRGSATTAAGDQKGHRSDLETTRQVRRLVAKDKALSTYAHNVKIITKEGIVTLRGPVRSQEEKDAIKSKAAQVAGEANVVDKLEIKNAKSATSLKGN